MGNGSPNPGTSRLPRARRFGKGIKLAIGLGVLGVVAAGVAGKVYLTGDTSPSDRANLVLHKVKKEKLTLTVVERGFLESAENSEVLCRVKAGNKGSTVASTIKWVIDDGSHVKKGQVIVELDDSGLQEQLKTQKITMDKARADSIKAEQDFKITESQNESDIKKAETDIELAKLDLDKFLLGEYLQSQKDIEGRSSIAEADLDMARDRASWSDRMMKKGYFTPRQAEAERSRLRSATVSLDKVKEESRMLEEFTRKRTATDLSSKLAEAKRSLDRIKSQAASKEVTAETERATKKSIYEQEESRFHEIEEEVRKCTILAPKEGMIVYYVSEQSRMGSGSQQSIVAQGEPVREGQKLMRIPDLTKMQVNTKVHEALVSRLKGEVWRSTGYSDLMQGILTANVDPLARLCALGGFTALKEEYRDKLREKEQRLLFPGQASIVRVDAYPDRMLEAHVRNVATVASQQDWMSADVKVYQTMVSLDESVEGLKPGMSAEVTILIDDVADNVVAIPIQAIVGSPAQGGKRKCLVATAKGHEEREIVIGLTNEKMAEIKSGLEEGEEVILNPRSLLGDKDRGRSIGFGEKADFKKGAMPTNGVNGAGGMPGMGGKSGGKMGGGPPGGMPGMGGKMGGGPPGGMPGMGGGSDGAK